MICYICHRRISDGQWRETTDYGERHVLASDCGAEANLSEVAQAHLHDAFGNYLRNVLAEGFVDRSTCLDVLSAWREMSKTLDASLDELAAVIADVGVESFIGETNDVRSQASEDVRVGEEG